MAQAGIRMVAKAPSDKAFRVRSQRSNFSEFQQFGLTALIDRRTMAPDCKVLHEATSVARGEIRRKRHD
jgi:hypothetical protein